MVNIEGESYIVINVHDGEVIETKNEHDIQSIVSISKIMTALVALNVGDFNDHWILDDEVNYIDGSSIYLVEGQQVSMGSLLYGLMLKSGNDVTVAIVVRVSGSEEKFVEEMNKLANWYV